MPELPEVETIRLGLEKYLVGKTVRDIEIRLSKQVTGSKEAVLEAKIIAVRRFGKALVIDLNNEYSIAIHIKMTGQLIYRGEELPKDTLLSEKVGKTLPNAHTHVIFHLDNGMLYYNDIRQFGWIQIVKTEDVKQLAFFKDLGPEPFKDLTLSLFQKILSIGKTAIKVVLLDQKKMAGIGNIYANDALFVAYVHPKRPANTLSTDESTKLFYALEQVLKKGLEVGGASEWQYVNALGQTGSYQNFFQVYGKDGKLCKHCGTVIEKITLGGRGTFFCSACQS